MASGLGSKYEKGSLVLFIVGPETLGDSGKKADLSLSFGPLYGTSIPCRRGVIAPNLIAQFKRREGECSPQAIARFQ